MEHWTRGVSTASLVTPNLGAQRHATAACALPYIQSIAFTGRFCVRRTAFKRRWSRVVDPRQKLQEVKKSYPDGPKLQDQLLPQSNAALCPETSPRVGLGREKPDLGDPLHPSFKTKEPTAPNSEHQDGSRSPPRLCFHSPALWLCYLGGRA